MIKKTTLSLSPRTIWVSLFMFVIMAYTSAQTSHHVAVTSNVYTPAEITINVGDTVIWTNTQGNHNVNGDQSVFPDNPASFSNAVAADWTWSYVFTLPGTYDYQCDPHINFGMFGKVHVEGMKYTLLINFTGMTPHIGQTMKMYLRDASTLESVDSTMIDISEADFEIEADILEEGESYMIDFYADHNDNGSYDTPPVDHAWRLTANNVEGDVSLDFSHNTDFTDIFPKAATKVDLQSTAIDISVYPNPSDGAVTVQSEEEISSLVVFSTTGAILRSYDQIGEKSRSLELDEFGSGLYFLEVKTESGRSKILKVLKF